MLWYMPVVAATWEAEISRIAVQGQPGQKANKTLISTNNLCMVACNCNPNYMGGHVSLSEASPGQNKIPY